MRFLEHLKLEWTREIRLPSEPNNTPKRITNNDIRKTLLHLEDHEFYKQIKALIYLSITSGLRAEELYQLQPEDIYLITRVVHIIHDESNGRTTKTKQSRISFFKLKAKEALSEYLI
jgi:integrase